MLAATEAAARALLLLRHGPAAPVSSARRGLAAASGGGGGGSGGPAGLFGIPRLQRPEDFVAWSREAVERCNQLVARVLASPCNAGVIQTMDDMSDEMCQVCDAAEACRNVHADAAWRAAAGAACAELGVYLAEVNQHEGLYRKLRDTMRRWRRSKEAIASGCAPEGDVMSAAEVAEFDAETALVGSKLEVDHEKSGVHLEGAAERRELRRLLALGQHYPSAFNAALSDPGQLGSVSIPPKLVPLEWRFLLRGGGGLQLPLDGPNLHGFLSGAPNEEARRMAYVAGNTTPRTNLDMLDQMIRCRSDMAALLGQPSYAHLKAADATLAATPEAAVAFLHQLAEGVRPLADEEAEALRRLKARHMETLGPRHAGPPVTLQPWDFDYYTSQARAALGRAGGAAVQPEAAAPYLQVDSVISGLSDLMARTVGIELRTEPLGAGAEGWAPGLRRLAVADSGGGRLGTLYLDLVAREGKPPGSVLFPIRCGRRLPDGSYQQPILALVTPCGPSPDRAAFTWRELRTFVHEMGHAVHNMASRTRYQHLWGTRCAQDVVEIPSHLWEHFVTDRRSLALIARHRGSRDPMPPGMHAALMAAHGAFPALELQQQVLLALVDLAYHGTPGIRGSSNSGGSRGGGGGLDTSAVWAELSARHSSIGHVPGTFPQARFSHLTIYGASYYSYPYARCLAEAVWRRHLADDPPDGAAGAEIRRQLLEPGGAVEPLDLVSGVLGGRHQLQSLGGGWSPRPDALLASVADAARRGLGGGAGGGGGGGRRRAAAGSSAAAGG
ncbi:hypothetical protein Rsub_11757 [Raphidocelis subcapitata]|uniref:Peptidase M3A/M3B catalytic domain-containing protein n=1 Tax=Raphidocelis subcapitata TaxID=307507 RepID=A0A2V0PQ71_9CHLO|nr:hypothetical protein Rsub_11757 [Raphidocelis subcapitata]|eukprot:GBF99345.1 hypothetical protein Rsub_11757 [Raphidocelis subcapitata]